MYASENSRPASGPIYSILPYIFELVLFSPNMYFSKFHQTVESNPKETKKKESILWQFISYPRRTYATFNCFGKP